MPKIYRLEYGQEEAAALYGANARVYCCTTTKKFVRDKDRRVNELHTVQIEWRLDTDGRYAPVDVPGAEKVIPGQLVILVMGFLRPEKPLVEKLGLATDERSNVKAEYGKFSTSVPGVFAAGDMRRGQSFGRLGHQRGSRRCPLVQSLLNRLLQLGLRLLLVCCDARMCASSICKA